MVHHESIIIFKGGIEISKNSVSTFSFIDCKIAYIGTF